MSGDWQRADILALIAIIVPIVSGVFMLIYTQLNKHADTRNEFIAWLENAPVLTKYQALTQGLLDFLQRVFGNAHSLRAFNTSLLLAFFYPIFFFILAYSLFDGSHSFGGLEAFPEKSEWKALYFPTMVIGGIIFGVIFKFNENIDAYLIAKLNNQDKIYRITISVLITLGLFLLDVDIWYMIMMPVFGYLSPVAAFTVAGAFAAGVVAFTIAVAVAVAGAFVLVVAVAVAGAVINALLGNYTLSFLFATFYLAFPLINALLDWFSWYISRLFLQRANQETHFGKIALDIFYDLIIALLFMVILCLLLPAGAELLNQIYTLFSDARIDWQSMALEAKQDPWGKGIMITLMLVTTLIPTAIHVFLGSFAVFINGAPGKKLATYLKQADHNASNRIPLVATFWMMSYAGIVLLAITAIIWLILTIAHLPIADTLYGITAYMYNL